MNVALATDSGNARKLITEENEQEAISFLSALASLGLMPLAILFRGWAAHKFWGWFLAPLIGITSPGTTVLSGLLCLVYLVLNPQSYRLSGPGLVSRILVDMFVTLTLIGAGYLLFTLT